MKTAFIVFCPGITSFLGHIYLHSNQIYFMMYYYFNFNGHYKHIINVTYVMNIHNLLFRVSCSPRQIH